MNKTLTAKLAVAALCASSALLSGCAATAAIKDTYNSMASSGRLTTYAQVVDKTLVDAFYTLSPDGKQQGLSRDLAGTGFEIDALTPSAITITRSVGYDANVDSTMARMERYVYAGESDAIARKYIETAKARGHAVRLYKPRMGLIINRNFKAPYKAAKNTFEWDDLDNALIEFDAQGKIISFMSRRVQAMVLLGVQTTQYATIYTGPGNARILENVTKNSDFQEYFVRDL